jgi:hypothetical protein
MLLIKLKKVQPNNIKMKKAFTIVVIVLGFSVYSQQKSMSLTARDILNNKLTNSLK